MEPNRCVNCKHCQLTPDSAVSKEGICRLAPPTTHLAMTQHGPRPIITRTLVHLTDDWCDQHIVQLVRPSTPQDAILLGRNERK